LPYVFSLNLNRTCSSYYHLFHVVRKNVVHKAFFAVPYLFIYLLSLVSIALCYQVIHTIAT
jgi:hypothetical protein